MENQKIDYLAFSAVNEDKVLLDMVESLKELVKMSMAKSQSSVPYVQKFAVNNDEYKKLNETVKEAMGEYLLGMFSLPFQSGDKQARLNQAFKIDTVKSVYFAITSEALRAAMPYTSSDDVSLFTEMVPVAMGGSHTFELDSNRLYDVQRGTYGTSVTALLPEFKKSITIKPKVKTVGVQFSVPQLFVAGYDWGDKLAKVAASFNKALYVDALNALTTYTALDSTPFVKALWTNTNYRTLATHLGAVNNTPTIALGTNIAWNAVAPEVLRTGGFATVDEYVREGKVRDIFGVPAIDLDQVVDTSTVNYDMVVPNDKIYMLPAGVKPVKQAVEDYFNISEVEDKVLNRKIFRYELSFDSAIVTPYMIGKIGTATS